MNGQSVPQPWGSHCESSVTVRLLNRSWDNYLKSGLSFNSRKLTTKPHCMPMVNSLSETLLPQGIMVA